MDAKPQKPKIIVPSMNIEEMKNPALISSTPSSPKPQKPKIIVSNINIEMKNSTLISSTPSSPTLRKASSVKYNCLCAPTTHAGSFRCRYHRNTGLTRSSASVGSKLSELAGDSKLELAVGSKLSDFPAYYTHNHPSELKDFEAAHLL
ncbi:hypothetical protein F0562_011323 [Nyssa sinensis]|uniref:Uncharacterized protein n=1 Tax=Nyssa sinensis TaxID=561372 RepID=A0A5J5A3K8_9ASTE|nr:hypothetical protein F0562_011323 [Nyssa sinensis]